MSETEKTQPSAIPGRVFEVDLDASVHHVGWKQWGEEGITQEGEFSASFRGGVFAGAYIDLHPGTGGGSAPSDFISFPADKEGTVKLLRAMADAIEAVPDSTITKKAK